MTWKDLTDEQLLDACALNCIVDGFKAEQIRAEILGRRAAKTAEELVGYRFSFLTYYNYSELHYLRQWGDLFVSRFKRLRN